MFTSITRRTRTFNQRLKWCQDTFGPGTEVHSVIQAELHRWSYEFVGFGIVSLHFQDENDYMFYVLRWG